MSFLGVLHPSMITVDVIKQHLLYFDKFHVPGLKMFKWSLRDAGDETSERCYAELDYLEQKQVIEGIDLAVDEIDRLLAAADLLSLEQQAEHDSYFLAKTVSPLVQLGQVDTSGVDASACVFRPQQPDAFRGPVSADLHPLLGEGFETIESDVLARAYSVRMNVQGVPTTPIIKRVNYLDHHAAARDEVVSIVVKRFPVPGDTVPFDEIFSFKSEHRHLRNHLQLWINDIARGGTPAHEVADNLEALLEDYEAAVTKLQGDLHWTTFETVLKVPFEVAEHLVRGKFSAAFGALFAVRQHYAKLLDEEAKLESRQVGYIHRARVRMKNP